MQNSEYEYPGNLHMNNTRFTLWTHTNPIVRYYVRCSSYVQPKECKIRWMRGVL